MLSRGKLRWAAELTSHPSTAHQQRDFRYGILLCLSCRRCSMNNAALLSAGCLGLLLRLHIAELVAAGDLDPCRKIHLERLYADHSRERTRYRNHKRTSSRMSPAATNESRQRALHSDGGSNSPVPDPPARRHIKVTPHRPSRSGIAVGLIPYLLLLLTTMKKNCATYLSGQTQMNSSVKKQVPCVYY